MMLLSWLLKNQIIVKSFPKIPTKVLHAWNDLSVLIAKGLDLRITAIAAEKSAGSGQHSHLVAFDINLDCEHLIIQDDNVIEGSDRNLIGSAGGHNPRKRLLG